MAPPRAPGRPGCPDAASESSRIAGTINRNEIRIDLQILCGGHGELFQHFEVFEGLLHLFWFNIRLRSLVILRSRHGATGLHHRTVDHRSPAPERYKLRLTTEQAAMQSAPQPTVAPNSFSRNHQSAHIARDRSSGSPAALPNRPWPTTHALERNRTRCTPSNSARDGLPRKRRRRKLPRAVVKKNFCDLAILQWTVHTRSPLQATQAMCANRDLSVSYARNSSDLTADSEAIQNRRNLCVIHLLILVHQDGRFLLRGQRLDGRTHFS